MGDTDYCPRPTEKIKMGYRLGKRTSSLRAFVCTYLYLYQNNKKSLEDNKKSPLALPHLCSCLINPLLEVLKPGGLIWASPSISHLSGSHLVFPRLYTCVAYMVSILVYLPLLFSLLSFSSFIKNPFSHKPHELKNRL